jgi:GT2 family glycosyltransferase
MDSISGHKIPISAIIPTYKRFEALKRTLQSISQQNSQPSEIIIIDASEDDSTYALCKSGIEGLLSTIIWQKATEKGAATQRNQGVSVAITNYILFMDDDILMEPKCIEKLWNAINSDKNIGGVNAMITNQKYQTPGKISMFMYWLMNGIKLESYAGKCIGPAWNIAPEDNDSLPDYVNVEWLNAGCTLYLRDALQQPLFPSFFKGYSFMEDVYLSLTVAKKWRLNNVRSAKIFHDTQPGDHKNSVYKVSKMQFVNRHYIMRYVLEKESYKDYLKLIVLEFFFAVSQLKQIKKFAPYFCGKVMGLFYIIKNSNEE